MPTPSRRWRNAAGLVAAAMVGALLLAGCSRTTSGGASGGFEAQDGAPGSGAEAPAAAEALPAPTAQLGKEGDAQQAPTQVEPQRSLIYTGTMSVKVDDVVKAADRAVDIAEGSGGAIGADRRTLDADRSSAQLILRVPADKFASTLDELAKLGTEESRAIATQDVTEQLIDLDARLTTQRASVERVRALLARAQTIGEVVTIESELARREAELASLEQRKEKLAGLVALSTITLNLRGPAAPAPEEETKTGFLAGLKSGWAAFLESIKILLTVAGWLLPWVIAVGAPIWLGIWLLRRRRPVPVPVPVTAGTTGPTGPPPADVASPPPPPNEQ